MSLSDDDVKHVARLSALAIKNEEVPVLKEQLNAILEYVDGLSQIPTRGVEPTFHIHGVSNIFREDIHQTSFQKEELQAMAPDFANGYFKVPQIIKSAS